MNRIRPGKMNTLRDIMLEKERLRYMALKTELELGKTARSFRKIFALPDLMTQARSLITDYIRIAVSNWFR